MSELVRFFMSLATHGFEMLGKYYSCYRGYVVDTNDPENLDRLKINIPEITGVNSTPRWALPFNLYAGKGYGYHCIPQVGDMVWVQFEKGNPNYPIWSYSYYGRNEKPEEFKSNTVAGFKSTLGHLIMVDNDKDNPYIRIQHQNKLSIVIDNDGVVIWGADKDVMVKNESSQVAITDAGVQIETEGGVWLNGEYEVLYNKIPGAEEILEMEQIGISNKVKVG